MQKQDNKEKNSNDLLDDLVEENGLILDTEPDEANAEDDDSEALTTLEPEPEAEPEEEEEPAEPGILDQKVFGMPRMQFQGAAAGVGCGYILSGLLQASKLIPLKSEWGPIIVCVAVGYYLGGRMLKKKRAEAAAAAEKISTDTPTKNDSN